MKSNKLKSEILRSLNNPESNLELVHYLAYLNGISDLNCLNIIKDKHTLINGWCEDYASYFYIKWKLNIIWIKYFHFCIKFEDKFYDGVNTEGVDDIYDLEFCRNKNVRNKPHSI